MEILKWLQSWYESYCDGDWEHENQVKIYTVDNPGWGLIVHIERTEWESITIPYTFRNLDDSNWYSFSVEKGTFSAHGDASKLVFLVNLFKEFMDTGTIQ